MLELRWYKYARALNRVLQMRSWDDSRNLWSEWETIPTIFEGRESNPYG